MAQVAAAKLETPIWQSKERSRTEITQNLSQDGDGGLVETTLTTLSGFPCATVVSRLGRKHLSWYTLRQNAKSHMAVKKVSFNLDRDVCDAYEKGEE